eukprot:CAMPEP_0172444066 /NCGR_PEP_ID=MMETSP1065-20121228/4195_1 /TAXON_ID=265537 /ORGANISM="Amphiprora paludosa, Strain CCMP125" /LENGTH=124 /DNA_ID=CAMNT_0013194485 /DNA_START=47 /DNA_END=421 /DNA_ORIENTATION=+
MAEHSDITWEKPAWAKGATLKKTGRGDAVKQGGNLAAPITDLPHQEKQNFEKPGWTGDVEHIEKPQSDLAKPITNIRETGDKNLEFEKPEWTKKKVLKDSGKGEAIKSGKEIARPIGGIKPVEE